MLEDFSRRELFYLLGAGALMRARMLAAQAAVPSKSTIHTHIDPEWFRKTLAGETEHWLKAAATPSGFFQVTLDREWRPIGDQVATLTSQNRQIFVMGVGYELTKNPAYVEALKKGADFLLAKFRDTQYALWFFSVSPDGKVLDSRKDCYGHAFTLLGLSHAARITRDQRYRDAALDTWTGMKEHLRYPGGFFKPVTSRDYGRVFGTNSQDPMMHLFEALLALHDATGSKEIYSDAEEHANNIYTKLYQEDGGYLPEMYGADWKPLPRVPLEVGHQFEWAYLLSHAVDKGFSKRYLEIGARLLAFGMKSGYDHEQGGIYSRANYAGHVEKGPKSWWQQCESLRAFMHYAALRKRADLWEPFDQTLKFSKANFIDHEYGGWFNAYDPGKLRTGAELNKGSVWQAGYHVCGMYIEALRLAGVMS
jgi:mannose/cellobiose epimerase-like protein (N-acyl-D-glucosamine 2-epimerase family)